MIAMDQLQKLTNQLEYLFLKEIINRLRDESISAVEAKELANTFLTMEPFTTVEDTTTKIYSLVAQNPKFELLKKYIDAYDDELRTESVINKMKKHLKKGEVDEALAVATR
jgi:hypothetical protein